jgi:hypothetical protein
MGIRIVEALKRILCVMNNSSMLSDVKNILTTKCGAEERSRAKSPTECRKNLG